MPGSPPDLAALEPFLEEDFVRASGPGGQNVNKVATAVQLRFDVGGAPLPGPVKARLRKLAGRRLHDDVLLIEARRYRTQERNRRDARERLAEMLVQAARPPKPRRPTRVPAGERRRRLEGKKRRGDLKRLRRSVGDDR